jgi:hypothetical protein
VRRLAAALGALALAASPRVVQACSVCGAGDPTLTVMGDEKPFGGRLRVDFETRITCATVGQGRSRTRRCSAAASRQLHEFGGPPVIIPMTPKMRRFLFALLRQAGKEPTGASGRGAIVVQVPARPFLRPAFEKFRDGASRRFLERVAREHGLAP